jgi:hypothetical protein
MATATAQDDDLLIIADDSASDDSSDDIEFSFDFGDDSVEKKETIPTEEVSTKTPIETTDPLELHLDSVEEVSEIIDVTSEVTPEATDTNINLGINFDTSSEESKPEVVAEALEVPANEEFSFDLGEGSEIKEEEAVIMEETKTEEAIPAVESVATAEVNDSTGDDTSMNGILSATIAQLAAREDVIATDKSSKSQSKDEIQAQIKDLQAQVKELEADMASLDSESDKITANITELENMKLDPVKEHNSRRAKK